MTTPSPPPRAFSRRDRTGTDLLPLRLPYCATTVPEPSGQGRERVMYILPEAQRPTSARIYQDDEDEWFGFSVIVLVPGEIPGTVARGRGGRTPTGSTVPWRWSSPPTPSVCSGSRKVPGTSSGRAEGE
jgi:hypothetical protein